MKNEKGAALIEAALVALVLCVILFGLIEIGFMYKTSTQLSSATRAGARIGAQESNSGDFYKDIASTVAGTGNIEKGDVLCVYQVTDKVNAGGSIDPTVCGSGRMFTYDGTNFVGNMNDGGFWSSNARKNCLDKGESVGVALQTKVRPITGILPMLNHIHLTEHTVMYLELSSDGYSNC